MYLGLYKSWGGSWFKTICSSSFEKSPHWGRKWGKLTYYRVEVGNLRAGATYSTQRQPPSKKNLGAFALQKKKTLLHNRRHGVFCVLLHTITHLHIMRKTYAQVCYRINFTKNLHRFQNTPCLHNRWLGSARRAAHFQVEDDGKDNGISQVNQHHHHLFT